MDNHDFNNQLRCKRIRLIEMPDDPNPIQSGTEGTILFVDDAGTIHVLWDDGRTLGVIKGVDNYEIL
ncbi:MAG: DUF4314 domain-containing protein [Candidatus Cloacimonetes bacterium]|nr:DUF4314 domain-containing protein [Candidatus Cloacimonadota bacterium]